MLHIRSDHIHAWLLSSFPLDSFSENGRKGERRRSRHTPLLRSTAISLSWRILGCESILSNLISRSAVIGNLEHQLIKCHARDKVKKKGTQDDSYTILFIMHKDLFQGNNRSLPFGSCLVDLTMRILVQSFCIPSPAPTQKYLLQAFPEVRSHGYSNIH